MLPGLGHHYDQVDVHSESDKCNDTPAENTVISSITTLFDRTAKQKNKEGVDEHFIYNREVLHVRVLPLLLRDCKGDHVNAHSHEQNDRDLRNVRHIDDRTSVDKSTDHE